MNVTGVTGMALQGIQQAAERFEVAASRASRDPAEILALAASRNLTAAMVQVAHIAEEMDAHILNLLA